MLIRIVVSLFLIPIVIYISYLGNLSLKLFIFSVQTLAVFELNQLRLKKIFNQKKYNKTIQWIFPIITISTLFLILFFNHNLFFVSIIAMFLFLLYHILNFVPGRTFDLLLFEFFTYFYLIVPAFCWLQMRNLENYSSTTDFTILLMVYCLTWLPDSAAYFVGSAIGKHKIAPQISPKKTWEGLFGGIVFTIAFTFLFIFVINKYFNNISLPGSLLFYLLFALLITVTGFMGDLFESILKRDVGTKDSSHLIPGHGGVLDRMDSFYFNIVFAYFYFRVFL